MLDPPSVPVGIPFTHDTSAGDRDAAIAAYLRLPPGPKPAGGWPVLLFICGLDAYRTDHTPRTRAHVDRGYATVSFEIPGTGDCPAAPDDPASPDRLMSSVLDWVAASAAEYGFAPGKILARGISTGGYYAFRVAHTHAGRLFAVVAQGGGCHHMFDAGWIRAQNQMEYPFALSDALAYKFGYRDADPAAAVTRYTAEARRFSLADTGVLATPACKLLVINGMEDSIFPIEVLPYEVGGHPGMMGAFVILQFGDTAANDVVYIESQAGDLFLESETDLNRFSAIFEHLRALALPPEASVSLITRIARDLST
ncbi:MAG TPA: Scr1 family TA system antitoxin-like transcriptional regulator [Streptosporangiaceae bacterium]